MYVVSDSIRNDLSDFWWNLANTSNDLEDIIFHQILSSIPHLKALWETFSWGLQLTEAVVQHGGMSISKIKDLIVGSASAL